MSAPWIVDPNPFKHPAVLLAKIREAIEPALFAAGFQFDGRNKPPRPVYLYLDYSRPGMLFRLSWDRRNSNASIGFVAEIVTEAEGHSTIATVDFVGISYPLPADRIAAEVHTRIDAFVQTVNQFLEKISFRSEAAKH